MRDANPRRSARERVGGPGYNEGTHLDPETIKVVLDWVHQVLAGRPDPP